jgi:hypothetical protein
MIANEDFEITIGYNNLYLSEALLVEKGYFIILTQNTGKVAIDTTGSALFSDLAWKSPVWIKLNLNSNLRLYLTPITNFSSYQTTFTLAHTYQTIGLYNLSIIFNNSNQIYQQTVNVTDCNFCFLNNYFIKITIFILKKLKIWI